MVTAGGFVKSSQQGVLGPRQLNSLRKSQRSGTKSRAGDGLLHGSQSLNHLQKSNFDADISDIDIEIKIEDDEDRQRLIELNFRESETLVGKVPFSHWTINRTIIAAQQQGYKDEKPQEKKEMRKEMIRDQVTKQVDLDALYPWLVNYNPVMVASGIQWSSKTIKEVVFCQNSQILGSSEPASVTFSSHKMSQYSYRSNSERSALRRRVFLNPYASYIGKEVGGT